MMAREEIKNGHYWIRLLKDIDVESASFPDENWSAKAGAILLAAMYRSGDHYIMASVHNPSAPAQVGNQECLFDLNEDYEVLQPLEVPVFGGAA